MYEVDLLLSACHCVDAMVMSPMLVCSRTSVAPTYNGSVVGDGVVDAPGVAVEVGVGEELG